MKVLLSLFLFWCCFHSNHSYALWKDSANCPVLSIAGPENGKVKAGNKAKFKLTLKDWNAPAELTYNWTVSNGTIIQGQGTDSILVDTKGLAGETIATTVEVGGLDAKCDNLKSLIVDVTANNP